jgi:glucose-1-phosphate adenylyltransferase
LEEEAPERVLILSGDHVYKMDYTKMLEFHFAHEAPLTVGAVQVAAAEAGRFGVLEVDRSGKIVSFQEKPAHPKTLPYEKSKCLASMGIYVFEIEKLVKALLEDVKKDTEHDFGKDIIPQMLKADDNIYCYDFSMHSGEETCYWRDVGTIDSYWEASMDLLRVDPKFVLHDADWPIRTYQEQVPPAKITHRETSGQRTGVFNSLICGGSIVNGARVERSILSAGTRVDVGAHVVESVIMQGARLGRNVKIKRTIIDEGVIVPEGCCIGYDAKEDTSRFLVSQGGVAVVPSGIYFD